MSLCVEFVSGVLQVVGGNPPPASCSAYLLVDATEYQQIVAANNIFAVPTVQELQAAWTAGFLVPMVAGMAAWAVGSVVNMFKGD
jgi:hypothetical protein